MGFSQRLRRQKHATRPGRGDESRDSKSPPKQASLQALACCGLVRDFGERAGARTQDQRLKRAMLYQLSYPLAP